MGIKSKRPEYTFSDAATYSASDARARFNEVVNRVRFGGESLLITSKGRAAVAVVPVDQGSLPGSLVSQLQRLIADHTYTVFDPITDDEYEACASCHERVPGMHGAECPVPDLRAFAQGD